MMGRLVCRSGGSGGALRQRLRLLGVQVQVFSLQAGLLVQRCFDNPEECACVRVRQ